MKRILLRDRGQFKAREVVTTVLEQPLQGQGITYAEMRARDRVLDAVERQKNQSYVDLEDADYDLLKRLIEGPPPFQFGVAKRELRLILDDIVNAKSPEETMQLKLIGDETG